MFRKAFLILFFSVAIANAACTLSSLDSIVNKTTTFNTTCVIFLDLNATINFEQQPVNILKTLDFGKNYTNNPLNITIIAPVFPSINSTINLSAGENYTNSPYNLTVYALHDKLNVNKSLNFGENYTNDTVNVTLFAPLFPKVNESLNATCGFSKIYSDLNLTIKAPACANVDKTLTMGEVYKNDDYKIRIAAPNPLNRTEKLIDGDTFWFEPELLNITCTTPKQQYLDFCTNVTISPMEKFFPTFINISENYTCNSIQRVCVDNLTTACNLTEKFGGELGFISCFNRIINETNQSCTQAKNDLNKANSQLATITTNNNANAQTSNALDDFVTKLIGGVAFLLGIFVIGSIYINKRNAEKRL